jgi:CheY-like chemotaxis protein
MTKQRVLMVDDDINLPRLVSIVLEGSGRYEVMIVHDSGRALAAAIQFKPHVMLLDINMPGKDGGELAREAASDTRLKAIPILFVTGLVSRGEATGGSLLSAGMTFLAKPVDPTVLLKEVDRLAGARSACT